MFKRYTQKFHQVSDVPKYQRTIGNDTYKFYDQDGNGHFEKITKENNINHCTVETFQAAGQVIGLKYPNTIQNASDEAIRSLFKRDKSFYEGYGYQYSIDQCS